MLYVIVLLRRASDWHWALITGQGYFLGILLTVLLMKVFSVAGIHVSFNSVAIALVLLGLPPIFRLRSQCHWRSSCPERPMDNYQRAGLAILVVLILARLITLFMELQLRPLFPWDAWMTWSPQPIVWFHLGEIVPFVNPDVWLSQSPDEVMYTLGASGGAYIPLLVPFLQLWGMLGTGGTDCFIVYLPWLIVLVATALNIYGYLRKFGVSRMLSLVTTYCFLTVPLLNVHAMLAGYSDLWVTGLFTSAMLAIHRWEYARERPQFLLVVFLTVAIALTKASGILFCLLIVISVISVLLARRSRKLLLITTTCSVLVLSLLAFIVLQFPERSTQLILDILGGSRIPILEIDSFEYHPGYIFMFETLILTGNWHLIGMAVLFVVPLSIYKLKKPETPASVVVAIVVGFTALVLVYMFTDRFRYAMDYTQLGRAMMPLIPSVLILLALFVDRALRQR
jgi:hypothetical protein